MRDFFVGIFGGLMSWWGLWLIAALDSSMIFFLPFGVDLAVVVLALRTPALFWTYPILAATGTIAGASITYYIGRRLGEAGLKHFVDKKALTRVRSRIENKGAVALAVMSLIPPPFPFTACVLAAGALKVSPPLFFLMLGFTRLLRFGAVALLAHFYGPRIIGWLTSGTVEYIGGGLFLVAIIGSAVTAVQLIHKTRAHRRRSRQCRAA